MIQPDEAGPRRLRVPPSKSQTQRALFLGALAPGVTDVLEPLECDDTWWFRAALGTLGVNVSAANPHHWRVWGGGPLRAPEAPLYLGNNGTALRFLSALATLVEGPLVLTGDEHLQRRPLHELVATLRGVGLSVRFTERDGFVPVRLERVAAPAAVVTVDVSGTSQLLSGLLMVAPRWKSAVRIEVPHEPVSESYVQLTLREMARFSAEPEALPQGAYAVEPAAYRARSVAVEGDWSSAAFLMVGGWMRGVPVEVENVDVEHSTQGDRRIVELLTELAGPGPRRFGLRDCPDLLPPLAVAAAVAGGRTVLADVAHARVKESDRLAVLARGLQAVGVAVQERDDGLVIDGLLPHGSLRPATLDPAGDHRMAMAFGLLSLLEPGIQVEDQACVSKSFPGFWSALEALR